MDGAESMQTSGGYRKPRGRALDEQALCFSALKPSAVASIGLKSNSDARC
jgi:hypothetical protein